MAFLKLTTIVVDDYDAAINFFVHALGFDLEEDTASVTSTGSQTGFLLARAEGGEQAAIVGRQTAGRVGFFLQVEDFEAAYQRLQNAGVEFVTAPRTESYGRVVVFGDIAGNRWDLLGPA
jgi:predicted enzyme related to lactoylglutathione lyase